ncbi:MAG: hypothetical protein RIR18_1432 [Pseudomonadota bacterium]|jgi:predicted AAA+ superfamily ATPase
MPESNVLLLNRHLETMLATALLDTPAVLINGPRQSGKTTLAKQCAQGRPYITLDDASVLAGVRADPQGFIRRTERAVIDEVQRAPELLLALKLAIDDKRMPGRYLLTGSANVMTLPNIADSLAGRVEVHTLLPLSLSEIEQRPASFLDYLQTQQWPTVPDRPLLQGDALLDRVLAGGYPEVLHRATLARRQAWANAYVTTLIQRDIQDVARMDDLAKVPPLLNSLALLSGQLLNLTQIGGQIGLNLRTVERYIEVLEKLYLVRRLPAWGRNELGRLVKTPKVHLLDTGLQSTLLRLTPGLLQKDRQRLGAVLETWVFGELLKALALSPDAWFLSHYRDKDQVEVDFVLESPLRQVIGIEVKASASVGMPDFKGLRRLRDQCNGDFLTGIVLYDGERILPFGDGLWAVPLGMM